MIEYCKGDLLESSAQCLVNPVNCVGVMGKGLALEFKKKYPDMFSVYRKCCKEETLRIGQIIFYQLKEKPSKIICLFPTKYHWRERSKLSTIEIGMKLFLEYAPKMKIKTVAFPQLGCGLGGLNFKMQVQPLMEKYLRESVFNSSIYI